MRNFKKLGESVCEVLSFLWNTVISLAIAFIVVGKKLQVERKVNPLTPND
jgi:hypothetical protein